jgi:diguanylate cyclase (GGDEF)-like protein
MLALVGVSCRYASDVATRQSILFIACVVGALLACWAILTSWQHFSTRRERQGWGALGSFMLLIVLGEYLRLFYRFTLARPDAFPTWADPAFLLAYLPLLVIVIRLAGMRVQERCGRMAILLEICIGTLALLTLLWYLSIGPFWKTHDGLGWGGRLLMLAYPALDLLLLVGVATMLSRDLRSMLLLKISLLIAAVLLALPNMPLAIASALPAHHSAGKLLMAWPVAFVLFGVAAFVQSHLLPAPLHQANAPSPSTSRWSVVGLYGAVALAGIAMLTIFPETYHLSLIDLGLLIGIVAVFILIALRLWVNLDENRRLYQQLQEAYEDMANLAHTDPLTQMANHRVFQERLEEEITRADRYDSPLALIFADLDHFKRINDTYGHQVGDAVLKKVGATIKRQARASDQAYRYAGEEFVVLLPETTLNKAMILAERIRQSVERLHMRLEDGEVLHLTISLGVSAYPQPSTSMQSLIRDADTAMYDAKEHGRNGVRAARPHAHAGR